MKKIIVTGFVSVGDFILVCGFEKHSDSKEIFEDVSIHTSSILEYCKGKYPDMVDHYKRPENFETEGYYYSEKIISIEDFLEEGLDYRIISEYMTEKSVLENYKEAKQSA